MPQQVNLTWQARPWPIGGGGASYDNDPSTGPYTGQPLIFDNATGLFIDPGLEVTNALATLIQAGIIGTAGNQQMQGPWFLSGAPGSGVPPAWSGGPYALTLQDGGLAWYLTSEGALTVPNASLSYSDTGDLPSLTLAALGDLTLSGGSLGQGITSLVNASSNAFLNQGPSGGTSLGDPAFVQVIAGPATLTMPWGAVFGVASLDLSDLGSDTAYYSLYGNTLQGQWGIDPVGNTVSGGLVTGIGSSLSVPWGDITGTPTSLTGYGISVPLQIPDGGTGLAAFAPWDIVCGDNGGGLVLQQVSGEGTLGQVLTSAGPAALPVWGTPASGGISWQNINPSSGPWSGSTLSFDNSTGLLVDALGDVTGLFASLTQMGMVGITQNQQLLGPLYFCPTNASSVAPGFGGNNWSTIMQDGGIGFVSSNDLSLTQPNFGITYTGSPLAPVGNVLSQYDLFLQGTTAGNPGNVTLSNFYFGQSLTMGTNVPDVILQAAHDIGFNAGFGVATLQAITSPVSFDLADTLGANAYYSINGGTYQGVWGALLDGSAVSGGLVTSIGSSLSVPWGDITGTPTSLTGYGISVPLQIPDGGTGLAAFSPWDLVCGDDGSGLVLQQVGGEGTIGQVLTSAGPLALPAWGTPPGPAIGDNIAGGSAGSVLYLDGSGNLADDPNFVYEPPTGLSVSGSGANAILCYFGVAGTFSDTVGDSVYLCDDSFAVNVRVGSLAVGGTAGNTLQFQSVGPSPSNTQTAIAPSTTYGTVPPSEWLGTPDNWALINLAGNQYLIPCYGL